MNIQKAVRSLLRKGTIASGMSMDITNHEFGTVLQRLWGTRTHAGVTVNDRTALQVTAWWGCVRVISETVGGLPKDIYEKDRHGNLTRVDHDLSAVLIGSPNPDMTSVEAHEAIAANLAQQGNAFAFRETRSDGSVLSLYPIEAGRVTVGVKDGEVVYDVLDRGRWEPYPRDKIWHIKGFSANGIVGLSPLVYARNALGLALVSEEFQSKFFAQGASPSFVVSVPNWLTDKQRAQARENLEKLWSGMDNVHRARLLEGGMTVNPGTMKLQEAQFAELRRETIYEICRAMRVPPHLVMELARSTNNNIEHQSLEWVTYGVMPYTTRLESSATKWLFKPEERSRFVLRYNLDGLLRADSAARGELISKLTQNAVLSRNEARAMEGLNRVNDPMMDAYTCQLQLVPISMLQALADAQARGKVQAPAPKSLTDALHLLARLEAGTPGTDNVVSITR